MRAGSVAPASARSGGGDDADRRDSRDPHIDDDGSCPLDPYTGKAYKYSHADIIRAAMAEPDGGVGPTWMTGWKARASQLQQIAVRPEGQRQVPPGYDGPPAGPAFVTLRPGIRYFKKDPYTGNETALEGRIGVHPDEAVQLVAVAAQRLWSR